MVLAHRLLPLLAGKLVVRRVVLEKPQIEVRRIRPGSMRHSPRTSQREAPAAIENEPPQRDSSILDLALVVSEIQLNDGSVTMRGPDGNQLTLAVEGLRFGLENPSVTSGALTLLHALTATGEMQARSFTAENARVRDLEGTVRLERGRLGLDDLAFSTDSGRFVADVSVDFNSIPAAYEMNLEGSALDVASIAGLDRSGGLGTGRLTLEAKGYGLSAANVKGEGVFGVEPGRLPPHPILSGVERALETVELSESLFEGTEVHFQLGDSRLVVERFHIDTKGAAMDFSGAIDLDGPLDLNLVVRYPHEGSEREALLRITGAMEEPMIELIGK
jgi:hypothetical protein